MGLDFPRRRGGRRVRLPDGAGERPDAGVLRFRQVGHRELLPREPSGHHHRRAGEQRRRAGEEQPGPEGQRGRLRRVGAIRRQHRAGPPRRDEPAAGGGGGRAAAAAGGGRRERCGQCDVAAGQPAGRGAVENLRLGQCRARRPVRRGDHLGADHQHECADVGRGADRDPGVPVGHQGNHAAGRAARRRAERPQLRGRGQCQPARAAWTRRSRRSPRRSSRCSGC